MVEALMSQLGRGEATGRRGPTLRANIDYPLILAIVAVALLGLVMVASASVPTADRYGDALSLFWRQLGYLGIGTVMCALTIRVRLAHLHNAGGMLLVFGYFLLLLVLVPGVGREVNGSVRWLPMVLFQLQVSEVAKICVFLYLAGYLVRRPEAVRTTNQGFLIPIAVLALGALLLLAEPDFGAAAVMMATGMALLFIAGVPLWRFGILVGLVASAGATLIVTSPYRWERFTTFLNPWADPFDSGFQLTQALIAIGRGGWFGVGLGNSVQKLFYLPEAHTDFLFAVMGEELGLAGIAVLVGLYGFIVYRAFRIAARSDAVARPFGAYVAWAVGFWFGLQAFVNMGVNMGLLPTKGLTLPLMSYGGSSLVMTSIAVGLLLRVDFESRVLTRAARRLAEEARDE